jgi:hypothetical protein
MAMRIIRAPAIAHSTIAANCLRRTSSGERPAKRSGGTGMSTIGASRGACFAASSLTAARSDSSSASRRSGATSGPPNLVRPHPTTGCSGVFCNSCDELHSIHECLVSRSLARNSSTRRDLPMPGCRPCREPWAAYFSVSRALSVTTRQGAQSRRCSSRQARASRPAAPARRAAS